MSRRLPTMKPFLTIILLATATAILIATVIAATTSPTNDATVRGLATGPWLDEAYSQLRSSSNWPSFTNTLPDTNLSENTSLGFATEDGPVLEITNAYIHIGNAYVIRVTDAEWTLLTNAFQKYVVIPPR